jgi:hypothetical protein
MSDLYPYTMGEIDAAEYAREEAKKEKERQKEEILSKASAPAEEPGFTAEDVGSWVRQDVYDPLMARLVLLEMRVKELEETATRYKGIWSSSKTYYPQDSVTHSGTEWICKEVCEGSTPGRSQDWKMTRKTGK